MNEEPERPMGQLAVDLKPRADELIVDSHDLPQVLAVLREKNATFAGVVEDPRLGLARLTGMTRTGGTVAELPAELRAYFAHHAGGWQPELDLHWETLGVIGPAGSKPMSVFTLGSKPMDHGDPQPGVEPLAGVANPAAGANVRVGVLDTPLFRHPAFTGHDVRTREWHSHPRTEPAVRAGHGTFVTWLVLNAAPAARIDVRGTLGSATSTASEWEVARDIIRLGDEVDVLNLSLASRTQDGSPSLVLRRAVERLPRDVLVVAAAGNHGNLVPEGAPFTMTSATPLWPAALPGVVAVGATGEPFSPKAPWVTCTAPGTEVTSAYPTGTGWKTWSGTSFAAAYVTGAVAARTIPGRVSPAEALEQLLDDEKSGVQRYHWPLPPEEK
jgi:subtilisin family serine protease